MLKNVKYLIFDADDTLLDYGRDSRNALEKTLNDFSVTINFSDTYPVYSKINLRLWEDVERELISRSQVALMRFQLLLNHFNIQHVSPELIADHYLDELSRNATLFDDVESTLTALHDDYTMFLLTNGISRVQRARFAAVHFDRFFSRIVVSDEVGLSKPDPALIELIMKDLFWNKDEVLIIGDSVTSDRELARLAHLSFCRVCYGCNESESSQSNDVLIHCISELRQILTV